VFFEITNEIPKANFGTGALNELTCLKPPKNYEITEKLMHSDRAQILGADFS
jgi:hypothetical protein